MDDLSQPTVPAKTSPANRSLQGFMASLSVGVAAFAVPTNIGPAHRLLEPGETFPHDLKRRVFPEPSRLTLLVIGALMLRGKRTRGEFRQHHRPGRALPMCSVGPGRVRLMVLRSGWQGLFCQDVGDVRCCHGLVRTAVFAQLVQAIQPCLGR